MKGSMRLAGALVVLLISGCVVSSPIASSGKNTYVVSSHSSACLKCTSASTALQAANHFCATQGKSLVIRNTSGYMSPFGYNTENQLIFSCRDEQDPALQQSASPSGMIFVDPTHD
jgi:hypothetical protein